MNEKINQEKDLKTQKKLELQKVMLHSKTHIIQMNDCDNKIPQVLLSSMIRSGKKDFDALKGLENRLDPKRLGRKNTTCFYSCNLEIVQSHLN